MKKYTPYIFPLVVLGIIFMLVFRWYTLRAERSEYALLGEGVEIENLSQEEMVKSIKGVGDYESIDLTSQDPENNGVVRYELKDDKVRFSVMANLPEPTTEYHVWLRSIDGTAMREVFTLVAGKGGYIGSAALPSELLPFEMIISESAQAEVADENYVLRGTLEVENDLEVEVLNEELN
ncbi:MAG: hypothetical protein BroJett025_09090 [Patescibacteria group bacterium]|nr:MAG: hypothetical protein BroJett025_09090 [Patescibacteria group bacterium]